MINSFLPKISECALIHLTSSLAELLREIMSTAWIQATSTFTHNVGASLHSFTISVPICFTTFIQCPSQSCSSQHWPLWLVTLFVNSHLGPETWYHFFQHWSFAFLNYDLAIPSDSATAEALRTTWSLLAKTVPFGRPIRETREREQIAEGQDKLYNLYVTCTHLCKQNTLISCTGSHSITVCLYVTSFWESNSKALFSKGLSGWTKNTVAYLPYLIHFPMEEKFNNN